MKTSIKLAKILSATITNTPALMYANKSAQHTLNVAVRNIKQEKTGTILTVSGGSGSESFRTLCKK